MEFFDLKNICENDMELLNPSTNEKVLAVGEALGLHTGSRVIDFGCGFGEALALWGERFGISGVGIDVREAACERARRKLAERGLADRIEIVCMKGADYRFEARGYDIASCMGSTFIWGGFAEAVHAMKDAIVPGGKLLVGEPYWLSALVPPQLAVMEEGSIHPEADLLRMAREEGFDIEYVMRASHADWDRYERDNWRGFLRWIEANPEHPERQQVIDAFHASQDEYFAYGREYFGWAMYILNPVKYA